MPFIALVIGSILVVAAIRDNHGTLFAALAVDIPAYVTWGAAILAIGAIGFVPNLKPVSRALMTLILIVLILNNYQSILSDFTKVSKPGSDASGSTSGNGSGDGKRGSVWVN